MDFCSSLKELWLASSMGPSPFIIRNRWYGFILLLGGAKPERDALKAEKVHQNLLSYLGENRFRVKLHAFDGVVFVAHPHHLALRRMRGYLKAFGHGFTPNHKRMVAGSLKGIGEIGENAFTIVIYLGDFAMHHAIVTYNLSSEGGPDGLVT